MKLCEFQHLWMLEHLELPPPGRICPCLPCLTMTHLPCRLSIQRPDSLLTDHCWPSANRYGQVWSIRITSLHRFHIFSPHYLLHLTPVTIMINQLSTPKSVRLTQHLVESFQELRISQIKRACNLYQLAITALETSDGWRSHWSWPHLTIRIWPFALCICSASWFIEISMIKMSSRGENPVLKSSGCYLLLSTYVLPLVLAN